MINATAALLERYA